MESTKPAGRWGDKGHPPQMGLSKRRSAKCLQRAVTPAAPAQPFYGDFDALIHKPQKRS